MKSTGSHHIASTVREKRQKRSKYILLSFAAILGILIAKALFPAEDACTYFKEDFSGTSGHTWTSLYGRWYVQDGKLNVDSVEANTMAHDKTDFFVPDFFDLDVDVEQVTASHNNAAFGLFPYNSGDVFFDINGRTISGVGAIVYPNLGSARLLAWDVGAQQWYQSDDLSLSAPPTSIGVSCSADAFTLRINGQNTSLRFSGDFSYSFQVTDKLWLFAQESGTHVRFDNVCAGPLGGTVVPTPNKYLLTVNKSGNGSGIITSAPPGMNCGTDCSEDYAEGTAVTLTASANADSVFTGWSGTGCTGAGSCSVTLNSDTAITANFSLKQPTTTHTLSAAKSGTGDGLIISFPPGINCGPDSTEDYDADTTVILTAIPSPGSIFTGWSGGGCTGVGDCTVSMNGDISAVAVFSKGPEPPNELTFPAGQQSFAYGAIASPIMNADPSLAKPIGLGPAAEWGSTLDLKIALAPLPAPADIYIAIFSASLHPTDIYLLTPENGLVTYSTAGLVPWKQNFTGQIHESVFENIPISVLPEGRYHFYLGVFPATLGGEYYIWSTSYSLKRVMHDIFISFSGLGGSLFVTSEKTPEFRGTAQSDLGINRVEYVNETSGRSGIASGTKEWNTNVELIEGENKISFFAIAEDDSESKVYTKVTYYQDQAITTPFDISDNVLFVNEPKEILFKINIEGDAVDKVKLLSTNRNGSIQSIEAVLTDDGITPDQFWHDGVYTAKRSITASEEGLVCFKIGISQAQGKTSYYSEQKCILVTEHYTSEDIQTAVTAANSASEIYDEQIAEGKSLEEAVQVIENRLKILPGMKFVEISPEGTVSWMTDAGILGGLDPESYNQKLLEAGTGGIQPAAIEKRGRNDTNDPLNESTGPHAVRAVMRGPWVGSRKAIIIQAGQWKPVASHYLNVWPMIKNNTSENACKLHAAKEIIGTSVTLDSFKNLHEYGYVHIHTHGNKAYYPFFGSINPVIGSIDVPWYHRKYIALETGVELPKKPDGTYDIAGFEEDFKAKRIAVLSWNGKHVIAIMPSFITHYVKRLPNSIVHLSACLSMNNYSLSSAFIEIGASAVVGYSQVVSSAESKQAAKVILDELYNGKSIAEAFLSARQGSDLVRAHYKFGKFGETGLTTLENCVFPMYYENYGIHVAIDDREKYKTNREAAGYDMPGDWYAECRQEALFQATLLENGRMELKICDCLSAFVDPTDGSPHCYNTRNTEEDSCRPSLRGFSHTAGQFQIDNYGGYTANVSGTYDNNTLSGEGKVELYFGPQNDVINRDIYKFRLPRVDSLRSCTPSNNPYVRVWD